MYNSYDGDGQTRGDASKQYGSGGTLVGKKYPLSPTFNAPKEAFDDANQYLFHGKSVDELFFPMHMNHRFIGMKPMEAFACHEGMKAAPIDNDFARFEAH